MSEAKVRVSLSDGAMEFEGSEAFVSAQVDKFSETIQARLAATSPKPMGRESKETHSSGNGVGDDDTLDQAKLVDVFAATDTEVKILKDVPGASGSEKTVNAAKLLLYGTNALKQQDAVLFEEVKAVCRAHGFYDSGNMAGYLKAEKSAFLFGGSGKKQTVKLTVPGMRSAEKLVAGLLAGDSE